jgi:uncharacterized iron-regulated membrane protein
MTLPASDDRKSFYDFWLARDIDSYEHYPWPGTHEVAVDRWSGRADVIYPANGHPTMTQRLWEDWSFAAHAGTFVGWGPRLIWAVFGMVPLLLAATGLTTWLIRRRKRRAKRRGGAPPGPPATA